MLHNDIEELLGKRPIPLREVIGLMSRAALVADPQDLAAVLHVARLNDFMDETIAYPALALLPAWGPDGLLELGRLVSEGPHSAVALGVLSSIATGRSPERRDTPLLPEVWDEVRRYSIPPEYSKSALRELRRAVLSSLSDDYTTSRLLSHISSQLMLTQAGEIAGERQSLLLHLLIDTNLLINEPVLEQFGNLLDARPETEEVLHRFLVQNPALLDPLATEVRTKHELGSDFTTDFVVRRANDCYVAVEIENSTDEIFTKRGTLSSALLEAEGQVRDFQAWIHQNIAYAQRKLPGIHRPEGLVVIGRHAQLDDMMVRRLDEENFMRRSLMRIVTYDDLLKQGWTIYRNLLERPPVLRARDQRTI